MLQSNSTFQLDLLGAASLIFGVAAGDSGSVALSLGVRDFLRAACFAGAATTGAGAGAACGCGAGGCTGGASGLAFPPE